MYPKQKALFCQIKPSTYPGVQNTKTNEEYKFLPHWVKWKHQRLLTPSNGGGKIFQKAIQVGAASKMVFISNFCGLLWLLKLLNMLRIRRNIDVLSLPIFSFCFSRLSKMRGEIDCCCWFLSSIGEKLWQSKW